MNDDVRPNQFDFSKITTVGAARNLMTNALKHSRYDLYQGAFRRLCEIEGKNHEDPVVVKFWQAIAAVEQILFEKHGRVVRAARTRKKAKEKGEIVCLIEWALGKQETDGFQMLAEKGLIDKTGEFIVTMYPDRFAPEVVEAATERLKRAQLA
ncbi:hypothetical protein [Rhizobium lentis]|uniref:hypothetical protein n=1 Tax=Rhizobium lentis TaxID=1138194 RepID=UPI001C83FCC2|nr:hypothetical protein [Rhizobium lentis]MBX4954752.1 hypothetical protein [Rhizobium lentis]MBX5034529.1 hypothetical protein [Rhizobium lentis]